MGVLRGLILLAIAAALSYWLLLYRPGEPILPTSTPPARTTELAVAPEVSAAQPEEAPPPVPVPAVTVDEPEPERPPPETGDPDGEDEVEEPAPAPAKEPREADRIRKEIAELTEEPQLLRQAEDEVAGRTRKGFQTVFLSAASDQLAIARAYEEHLILVPRAGLDPERPHYFRLLPTAEPRVVEIDEKLPLERFRQYRNLFAYPYEDLPRPLRDLRRSVPNRGEVYLFAALIPPSEWALVIARREEALAECNRRQPGGKRSLDEVRRFTMRYAPLPGGGFDIRVAQIQFADGTRWSREDES
jgi:hypothetical protein